MSILGLITGLIVSALVIWMIGNTTVSPFFRWYDLWIGFYVDTKNKTVYFCPLPMIGLKIEKSP